MNIIEWNDRYLVGDRGVDDQHKELFRIINEGLSLATGSGYSKNDQNAKLRDILEFLQNYVVNHFSYEEKLQKRLVAKGYGDHPAHVQLHKDFTKDFLSLKDDFEKGGVTTAWAVKYQRVVAQWLPQHISRVDQKMSLFLDGKDAKEVAISPFHGGSQAQVATSSNGSITAGSRWLLTLKFQAFTLAALAIFGFAGIHFLAHQLTISILTKEKTLVEVMAKKAGNNLEGLVQSLPPDAFDKKKAGVVADVAISQAQTEDGGDIHEATQADVENLLNRALILTIVILLAIIYVGFYWMVAKPNAVMLAHLKELADGDGDLTRTVPELGTLAKLGKDEISLMAATTNRFIEKTRDSIANAQAAFAKSDGTIQTIKERALNSESTTAKQASSVEALAASMEELSATSHSIRNLAQTNSAENQKVSEATRLGFDACIHAREAAQKSSQKVEDIVEALTTIKSIAEATSRLSLNANIEAARAGEHGKGFAVVANEIRELAQQVAKSVKIIEGNINDAKNATEENNAQIEKLEIVLREVAEKIASVAQNNAALANNVNAQASSIDNNGDDVTTLAGVSVEITNLNRKIVDVIEEMSENIGEANNQLNYFKV